MLAEAPVAFTLFLAAVAATALTITRPAHGSLVPDLATTPDEITAANVVTSTAEGVGILIGPGIAGLVLLGGEPGQVYLTLTAGLVLASLLVVRVRGHSPPPRLLGGRSQLLAGLATVRADRDLRAVVVIGATSFILGGSIDVLAVILAVDILGWGNAGAGALASAAGLGTLIGAIAASVIVGRRLSRALWIAVVLAAVPLALLGWLSAAALALLLASAAGLQWTDLITRTLLQRVAPATTLARVLGVYEGLASGSLAIGSLLVSGLFTTVQSAITFPVLGLLLPVAYIICWTRIRKLDRTAPLRLEEVNLLRQVPMFARLSPLVVETLAANLALMEVAEGVTVVREGDSGNSLYLIADGKFTVEKTGTRLATLAPGDLFGEIALLYDLPRTATVRSVLPGRVYTLGRREFMTAMGATGEANIAARRLAEQRLGEQRRMDRPARRD